MQVILTGDYWHSDFQDIICRFDLPLTLVPLNQLDSLDSNSPAVQLVVVAQSRRGQLSEEIAQTLGSRFPGVPLIALLGSWCEGETRSGDPMPGFSRVFWHQWKGRYQNFLEQMAESHSSDWHLPRTSTLADLARRTPKRIHPRTNQVIGVSAKRLDDFETLADALDTLGFTSVWLQPNPTMKPNPTIQSNPTTDRSNRELEAIVIDGSSLTVEMEERIAFLKTQFEEVSQILVLNFPRRHEIEAARNLGIDEMISKPFLLSDLGQAIARTTEARGTKLQV